jgi:hypothetical protein
VSWRLVVYRQERGTKKERSFSVDYASREEAIRAVEKLEADLTAAEEQAVIVVSSSADRISFVKQDFRSTQIFEA